MPAPEPPSIAYLPADRRDVLILRNPKAGAEDSEHRTRELAESLTARGFEVREFTDIDAFSHEVGLRTARGSLRAVVSAGGDGTATLVVDRVPVGTPILLFPLGTENLLSRYVGHGFQTPQAVELIEQGAIVRLDAGLANGRLFLIVLGCGFDADVVQRVHRGRAGHINRWTYAKPILQSIRSYDYPELKIYCETEAGEAESWACRWAFVVNLPRYAGGLNFVPSATGSDGLLNVCTFRRGSLWRGLRYLLAVMMGRHLQSPDVRTSAVRTLRIESNQPVSYQLDGDPGGELPVEIQVLPERLTLLINPSSKTLPL